MFDIVEVAAATGRDQATVMATYFRLGSRLELNWLRDRILELPQGQPLAGARAGGAARRPLQPRTGADPGGARGRGPGADAEAAIDAWIERNALAVERCLGMLADIKASRMYDTTTLPVALREVRNLIRVAGAQARSAPPAPTAPTPPRRSSTLAGGSTNTIRAGAGARSGPTPLQRKRRQIDHAGHEETPAGRSRAR